jgi:lambda repressor-like predicted transcriptional regulator
MANKIVSKPVHKDRSIPAKALLKRDGFSTYEISHAAGTSQSTTSNVLNGHSHNDDVELAICKLYPKLSLKFLLGSDS